MDKRMARHLTKLKHFNRACGIESVVTLTFSSRFSFNEDGSFRQGSEEDDAKELLHLGGMIIDKPSPAHLANRKILRDHARRYFVNTISQQCKELVTTTPPTHPMFSVIETLASNIHAYVNTDMMIQVDRVFKLLLVDGHGQIAFDYAGVYSFDQEISLSVLDRTCVNQSMYALVTEEDKQDNDDDNKETIYNPFVEGEDPDDPIENFSSDDSDSEEDDDEDVSTEMVDAHGLHSYAANVVSSLPSQTTLLAPFSRCITILHDDFKNGVTSYPKDLAEEIKGLLDDLVHEVPDQLKNEVFVSKEINPRDNYNKEYCTLLHHKALDARGLLHNTMYHPPQTQQEAEEIEDEQEETFDHELEMVDSDEPNEEYYNKLNQPLRSPRRSPSPEY